MTTVEKAALLIDVDLFQAVPSDALAELAARMDETAHETADVLLESRAVDARLWIIVEGLVHVQHDDGRTDTLTRGQAFGLLSVLGLDEAQTVVAGSPCRMLSIAPDEYLDALADSTAFALANLRALGRRLQACQGGEAGLA